MKVITPFKIAVEEVVVGMIQETGAMEQAGDNIIENMESLGYTIHRKVSSDKEEFITLVKDEKVVRIVFLAQVGDEIQRVEMDHDEMLKILKERDQVDTSNR